MFTHEPTGHPLHNAALVVNGRMHEYRDILQKHEDYESGYRDHRVDRYLNPVGIDRYPTPVPVRALHDNFGPRGQYRPFDYRHSFILRSTPAETLQPYTRVSDSRIGEGFTLLERLPGPKYLVSVPSAKTF